MRSDLPESTLVHGITAAELVESIAAAVLAKLEPVIESTRQRGLLSRDEMAEFLGVSGSKIDDMVRHGKIPSIRLGTRRVYDADAVLARLSGGDDHA